MTAGTAKFWVDSLEYDLKVGEILIIPPYAIHRAVIDEGTSASYDCICFDLKLLSDEKLVMGLEEHSLSVKHLVSGELCCDEGLQKYVSAVCRACELGGDGWELEAVGNISLLFYVLKRKNYFTDGAVDNHGSSFAERAINYILENYALAPTSATAAESMYMSHSYFCRLFKKTFGCPFANYLLAYRLERAKLLLSSTLLPMTEIALKVGFGGGSYFGKAFKELFGMSPLSYRKNTQSQSGRL